MKDKVKNPYRFCRVKEAKKVFNGSSEDHLWKAEANVDTNIVVSRPTLKVLREEVINGKVYKVLSIPCRPFRFSKN